MFRSSKFFMCTSLDSAMKIQEKRKQEWYQSGCRLMTLILLIYLRSLTVAFQKIIDLYQLNSYIHVFPHYHVKQNSMGEIEILPNRSSTIHSEIVVIFVCFIWRKGKMEIGEKCCDIEIHGSIMVISTFSLFFISIDLI